MNNAIEQTKEFLKNSFIENPHFSFNDWKIMYNHSMNVLEFSLKIAGNIDCDKMVLSIGALLHDIGKTYQADKRMAREKHKELAFKVSEEFLKRLEISSEQILKLKKILSNQGNNTEKQIIREADIIAFLSDEQLQTAFKEWAERKNLQNEMKRKLDKFNELKSEISKEIAQPFYQQMKNRWNL